MAKLTTAEFIEAIKELSVLELNELVKACEEEFGVSAAAGVVVAAAGGAAEAAERCVEETGGILYTLLQAVGNGHTYLPEEELKAGAAELLKVDPGAMDKHLMDMQMDRRLIVKETGQGRIVYAAQYYYTELNTARMLHDLNITGDEPEEDIRKRLAFIQEQEDIELDELQVQAVIEAVNCGLLIITGGPGTGKTTTINIIIRYFEMGEMEILLAAPTGRAAKRMTEATGYEARTCLLYTSRCV